MRGRSGQVATGVRHATAAAVLALGAVLVPTATAHAEAVGPYAVHPAAARAADRAADRAAEQEVVETAVATARDAGIKQSISVVDRATGDHIAASGGAEQYISESIVKLFTVAYYEHRAGGNLDDAMSSRLRSMIINSDDAIESSLWNTDIVPDAAATYGLPNTVNGPKTGPHDWGWELITADDETHFLFAMSKDPEVAPLLMPAMAAVAPNGSDGFDQSFGLNALSGDHGSKQGWTDVGSTPAVQIHSVGWTDRYFVAILQTSTTAGYDAMRAAATATAHAVQDGGTPPVIVQAPPPDPAVAPATAAALTTALTGCRRDILTAIGGALRVAG